MPNIPLRRAHVVGMTGVGAMTVSPDGTTMIAAGLDHWFKRADGGSPPDLSEFRVEEWRLERELDVDHFRLPPDFRIGQPGSQVPNTGLKIPFLRFPRWHICRFCHTMQERKLSERGPCFCDACKKPNRRRGPKLSQVPFVAMCDAGHLQDFPWREWVHRSAKPTCQGNLSLSATGAASLQAIRVRCSCGKQRTLAGITEADADGENSHLTRRLRCDGLEFRCQGFRPWHHDTQGSYCDRPLRGSLLSASNVYFSLERSSIYLPRSSREAPAELVAEFEKPAIAQTVKAIAQGGQTASPTLLRTLNYSGFAPYTDKQIAGALKIFLSGSREYIPDGERRVSGDEPQTRFRREEFQMFQKPRKGPELTVRCIAMSEYDSDVMQYFSKIMLVDRLRETRVQYGFERVFPASGHDIRDRMSMMRKSVPEPTDNWLPAYIVHGEGLFLEFDEVLLREWECRAPVVSRIERLRDRYARIQVQRRLHERAITPRFILLHTFAHLLINRLAFECGYSAASLKERLYVSRNPHGPMAGVLIYTAAGDAEGTLGGLVRMGKPGYLEPVIRRALEAARWCSSDPICMELGRHGGSGPDSCNLAACHACALLPETACEEFNRFLDRAVVVGDLEDRGLGFFSYE